MLHNANQGFTWMFTRWTMQLLTKNSFIPRCNIIFHHFFSRNQDLTFPQVLYETQKCLCLMYCLCTVSTVRYTLEILKQWSCSQFEWNWSYWCGKQKISYSKKSQLTYPHSANHRLIFMIFLTCCPVEKLCSSICESNAHPSSS